MTLEDHKKFRDEIGDDKIIKKINTYVHKFHIRINSLNVLEKSMRHYFMGLTLHDTQKEVYKNFEGIAHHYLMNLIFAIYRDKL